MSAGARRCSSCEGWIHTAEGVNSHSGGTACRRACAGAAPVRGGFSSGGGQFTQRRDRMSAGAR
eukprot:1092415-Prorocentrum_minimum.AAC.1